MLEMIRCSWLGCLERRLLTCAALNVSGPKLHSDHRHLISTFNLVLYQFAPLFCLIDLRTGHEVGQNKVNKGCHLYKENTTVDKKKRGEET